MRDAEQSFTRIEAIRKANSDPTYVNDRLYRLMYKQDLYIAAYEKIKSKPGNMTAGQDGTTLDEFSIKTIQNIIIKMKDESFTFRGARRVLIPKANGKTRPLSVAPPTDKVVQEVIRSILEAIFEPTFSDNSHGFRAGKSCHTALKQVRDSWSGVTWIVEGDIKGCFDNISHSKLIEQLRLRIKDERFINLIRKALNAGYFENGAYFSATLGTPQGSIISPILANVFLHQLDRKVEQLIEEHTKGKEGQKVTDPAYRRLQRQKTALLKKAAIEEGKDRDATISLVRVLNSKLLTMPPYLTSDNGFVRVKYVRYADDWIVGVNGPKQLAEQLRSVIGEFLKEAGLELSIEKTHIRHAKSETAKFLGTNLRVGCEKPKIMIISRNGTKFPKRVAGWTPVMYAPMNELIAKLHAKGFCDQQGNPTTVNKWIFLDDNQIVEQIGSVWRGIANYYSFIDKFSMLSRIQFILQHAVAKTLATKHRSSRSKIFSRHGANLRVRIRDKAGNVIRQVEFPLIKKWTTSPNRFKIGVVDTNFLERSLRLRTRSKLDSPCVICGSDDRVAMHHVKHIRKMGQEIKGFKRVMVSLNRKQIPVCHECHHKIHQGKYDGISLKDFALPHTAAA